MNHIHQARFFLVADRRFVLVTRVQQLELLLPWAVGPWALQCEEPSRTRLAGEVCRNLAILRHDNLSWIMCDSI